MHRISHHLFIIFLQNSTALHPLQELAHDNAYRTMHWNYQIIRRLGQGSFASVYLAEQRYLHTQAAIKILSNRLAHEDTERFHLEAQTIARLEHAHIIRLLDFGVEEDLPYLIMQYAPGGSLRQRHPRGLCLPLPTILEYVEQIAPALDYAHQRRVIHRDIKPENILLGQHAEVFLSDFRIALILQSSLAQHAQDLAGTMSYMAPEQIEARACPASDQSILARPKGWCLSICERESALLAGHLTMQYCSLRLKRNGKSCRYAIDCRVWGYTMYLEKENLALRPGVHIAVSVRHPTGGAARDPHVLLNEAVRQIDNRSLSDFFSSRTYDTYDGQQPTQQPDWYALEFPEPVAFNCVEMTMGIPFRDGGWWTSLDLEVRSTPEGPWQSVKNLAMTPLYDFSDGHNGRLPFETYALTFDTVTARSVRLIGMPGGIACFTSLARIAVYQRDLSRWNPASLPSPPIPHLFRLIQPQIFWDFAKSLTKLTGLTLNLPYVEYYLDAERYERFWQMVSRNYQGKPELWFFLADAIGWDTWAQEVMPTARVYSQTLNDTQVRALFDGQMVYAVAPIVVDNQVLEALRTEPVILKERFDLAWHQRYAQEHQLSWSAYQAALERSPQLTLSQMEGAAELLGMIANTIVGLARQQIAPEGEVETVLRGRQGSLQRKAMIQKAIAYMQTNLEKPIDVTDVANLFGISSSYFCTLFTEQIGSHPGDYLIHLRLERAKKYLAYSHMSITNVCVKLGYTPSHFSRLFKRYTGYTPSQYTQQMRAR